MVLIHFEGRYTVIGTDVGAASDIGMWYRSCQPLGERLDASKNLERLVSH